MSQSVDKVDDENVRGDPSTSDTKAELVEGASRDSRGSGDIGVVGGELAMPSDEDQHRERGIEYSTKLGSPVTDAIASFRKQSVRAILREQEETR